jgi:hypothetical protein
VFLVEGEALARDAGDLKDEAVASASAECWLICSELLNFEGIVLVLCTRFLT